MTDYKDTLLLPQTEFPMKADLARREPEFLARWESMDIYNKLLSERKSAPPFILHDGPPYANGDIHIGHIMNKVLKDITIKFKAMSGFATPLTPGWDCHGLPIELQVEKELGGKKKEMTALEIRQKCRDYAAGVIDRQREQFKRLGAFADWDNPYRTMDFSYEGQIAREFANCVEKGMVYRGRKPIYWCMSCATALAEAEVEYADHSSPSIYVKFRLNGDEQVAKENNLPNLPMYMVIWTTTPWTLPANLGIALNPHFHYVAVQVDQELWVVAEGLVRPMLEATGLENAKVVGSVDPKLLDRKTARHPFIDRDSLIVMGDHVTIDAGTGCVHTAPGHGQEDFIVGQKYGLDAFAPLDHYGKFTQDVNCDWLVGVTTTKANPLVIDKLKDLGALIFESKISHSYPHCWRCKKPVIYRATEQWFLSMEKDNFRSRVLEEVDRVQWIPSWGRERIFGMLQNRPDWCLSRQRSWGVPIVAVTCTQCNQVHTTPEFIRHVASVFDEKGADAWYSDELESLMPEGFVCPTCNTADHFVKEWNILDVWFDSGVSYAAVIEKKGIQLPVDLYLEGSDQHRGWFHTSLLTAMATRGHAPYKAVLTHGFVMDAEGRKYSKSAKNFIPPEEVIAKNGAEVLRLWVSAEDYRNDTRFSSEILSRVIEGYRKIRNTARFILGNLNDFDPKGDFIPPEKMQLLDRYALHLLRQLVWRCQAAYQNFEFHAVYHALNQFCTVDMSAFYLDVLKDRLYCEKKCGELRRSAQSAMWIILETVARLIAPILSFTAEEIWQFSPTYTGRQESVFLAPMPTTETTLGDINPTEIERWERLREFRSDVTAVIEPARKDKEIGNSLDAKITVSADGDLKGFLERFGDELADLLLVSEVEFGPAEGKYVGAFTRNPSIQIAVTRSDREKCERCWRRASGVGQHGNAPTLCTRCIEVVG
ncbi:MAG: isoleucine--tRNA ligase [Deltaproteobacteria bacterium CG11_big_fil_rev_8_21_14_0_20_47_16]|nr:MAG: isoleucine--tRNA ligase [Deltaproteobacteria bacterium CG11_big_fil_rev_8_21_14_0_20_47_16]